MFPSSSLPRRQRGFTLVELMIASAIGLLVLASMATLFVSNSRAQTEIEKANRQIENGRYAIDLLTSDLRNAGYYGEFDPSRMPDPAALPDPCDTDLADIRAALPLSVQGFNNAEDKSVDCLTDLKPDTDIVVVRRVETCFPDQGSCEPEINGGAFLQASLCNNTFEAGAGDVALHFDLNTDKAGLTRHQRNCTMLEGTGDPAPYRRYLTSIYYIALNDNENDGIPTLKRASLVGTGNQLKFTIAPLVEGVENLQLEYGMDLEDTVSVPVTKLGDGISDLFHTNPAVANGCATTVCAVSNWRSVVSVKISLLARNLETTLGYKDEKSYRLGNLDDGTANLVPAPNDSYKRHVFQSLVALPNPAGRRAK